jgi:predicted 3-demethylubiquinone-9 3-methyltransferase (glyoxalase superfamily)
MSDKIGLCLWFDGQAEDAANFYVSTFRACGQPAEITRTLRHGEAGPGTPGTVLAVEFVLAGQTVMALNGGPQYKVSPAISLMVDCADQAEVDRFWDALTRGGAPVQCGWLTDRFGVSWQIVPTGLVGMLCDPDPAKAARAMRAMMSMVKFDIAAIEAAHAGRTPA